MASAHYCLESAKGHCDSYFIQNGMLACLDNLFVPRGILVTGVFRSSHSILHCHLGRLLLPKLWFSCVEPPATQWKQLLITSPAFSSFTSANGDQPCWSVGELWIEVREGHREASLHCCSDHWSGLVNATTGNWSDDDLGAVLCWSLQKMG